MMAVTVSGKRRAHVRLLSMPGMQGGDAINWGCDTNCKTVCRQLCC